MGRDFHQAELNGAVHRGGEQLIQHLLAGMTDDPILAPADDQPFRLGLVVLEKQKERHMKGLRNILQGIDGRVHRVVLDLAEHRGAQLHLCGQLPQAQPAFFTELLHLPPNVQLFVHLVVPPFCW